MVMKPNRSPATSRGNSPNRNGDLGDNKRKFEGSTPNFYVNARSKNGSRGVSPARSESTLFSAGSDYSVGSIEQYDERHTSSKRLLSKFKEGEDNINVVVRVRPLNGREQKNGDTSVIQFPGKGQIICENMTASAGDKSKLFSYNVAFEPAATQEDVLQFSGMKRLIEMAVEGFRCTAFCYGQTGSGKTHTLTGPPLLLFKKTSPLSNDHGLVFRSFMYLFQLIQEKPDINFVLKASFLEIYNEKVIDLLNPGSQRKPLAVRWSKKARGFFVENLFTVDCEELDDLMAVLEEGMRNRSVGSHNMNDYSSRSHTILTVHISSEIPTDGGVFLSRTGKINFVDLAGSEMTKKTHSEGKTLEEANNINKSLMVLGYCIATLSDPKRKNNHIPYRDSKLTKLLADSLAGNGATLMIACISPARSNLTETVNTLRYAARAKKIKTKPVVLMDPREALILSLQREVSVLESENEHLRSALHMNSNQFMITDPLSESQVISHAPKIDIEKLSELETNQLVELVKLYVSENEALRKENNELFQSREGLLRDQDLVCRENERLLKKLEDVNSACCRSPIIPARNAISNEYLNKVGEDSSTNIWRDPLEETKVIKSMSVVNIPESIQKELDKRRLGETSFPDIRRGHTRNNSWEGKPNPKTARIRSSESDGGKNKMDQSKPKMPAKAPRRFSLAKEEGLMNPSSIMQKTLSLDQGSPMKPLQKRTEIFGSTISLHETEGLF